MKKFNLMLPEQSTYDKLDILYNSLDMIDSWRSTGKQDSKEAIYDVFNNINPEKICVVDKPVFLFNHHEEPNVKAFNLNKLPDLKINRTAFYCTTIKFESTNEISEYINNNEFTFIYSIFVDNYFDPKIIEQSKVFIFRGVGITWTDLLTKYRVLLKR